MFDSFLSRAVVTALATVALALTATACATTDSAKSERFAAPQAKIAAAEEAGATEIPKARLALKLAKDRFELAKKALEDGEDKEARMLLDEAHADAKLALAIARERSIQTEAHKAIEDVIELQRQLGPSAL